MALAWSHFNQAVKILLHFHEILALPCPERNHITEIKIFFHRQLQIRRINHDPQVKRTFRFGLQSPPYLRQRLRRKCVAPFPAHEKVIQNTAGNVAEQIRLPENFINIAFAIVVLNRSAGAYN